MTTAFVCEICGKSLTTAGNLKNHIRLSHGTSRKDTPEMTEKPTKAEADTNKTLTTPSTQEQATVSLTPEERALIEQVSRSKDDWQTIGEDDMLDYSLSEDPFKLPKEAKERQERKEFAYRWCERSPKRVAELTNASPPLKWWVANSVTAPYLQRYVDPTIGGVCRMDQILLLKPWGMHSKVKAAVDGSAKALYNSRELEKGGAQKVQSRDSSDHLKVITGERAHVKGGDTVFEGENQVSAEVA